MTVLDTAFLIILILNRTNTLFIEISPFHLYRFDPHTKSTMPGISKHTLAILAFIGLVQACDYARYLDKPIDNLGYRRCTVGVRPMYLVDKSQLLTLSVMSETWC
jgi:hypothetical protein